MPVTETPPDDPAPNLIPADPLTWETPDGWDCYPVDTAQYRVEAEYLPDYRFHSTSRDRNATVEVMMDPDSELGEPYSIEARTEYGEMALGYGTAEGFLAALTTTLYMMDLLDKAEQAAVEGA